MIELRAFLLYAIFILKTNQVTVYILNKIFTLIGVGRNRVIFGNPDVSSFLVAERGLIPF